MDINELHARIVRLERELAENRELLRREAHDPQVITAELVRTRAYAFDASLPRADLVQRCLDSIDRYGFCVIDKVIPEDEVEEIREEVSVAQQTIARNVEAVRETIRARQGASESDLAAAGLDLRPVRRANHPPKPPNDIIYMPKFARYLAAPQLTAVARHALDDHLRIAQLHARTVPADRKDGSGSGFGPAKRRGNANFRGWHTDWPHDLSAYGRGDPYENVGCMRQPFPDLTMCLVMIWYLTDVDEESGGTWAVPGSHKDKRNPRGPSDNIMASAPIPGDLQIRAKAGAVYIQDSRTWHASPRHNFSGRDRIAMVARFCPWWLAVDDFAPGDGISANTVCRPLSREEYLALPGDLQPPMRHCCPEERDTLQQPVLDRAHAADLQNAKGFQLLEEHPEQLPMVNDHITVPVYGG